MNSSTEQMLDEIAARGWGVTFNFNHDRTWDVEGASAGDCNCSHMKEYDPSDGHGWSHCDIPAEKFPKRDNEWTFENMVTLIHAEIMKIEPGKPVPGHE